MQLITVYIISCSNNSDMFWLVCLAIETKTSYANHSCLNRRVVVMYHVAIQVSCVLYTSHGVACVYPVVLQMSCGVACVPTVCHMSRVATRVLCCVSHGIVFGKYRPQILKSIVSPVKVILAFQIKH